MQCQHCSVDASPYNYKEFGASELAVAEIDEIAAKGKSMGANSVVLSGGEPLTRKDFEAIFNLFIEYGYKVTINTNGTLINNEIVKLLNKKKERVSIGISLDGKQEFHDNFRRNRGAFYNTITAIKELIRHKINIEVNCTLFKENYPDRQALLEILNNIGVTLRITPYVAPSGGGKGLQNKNLTAIEVQSLITEISNLRKNGYSVYVNAPLALLPPDDAQIIECGWGETLCGIDHKGNVCICPVSNNEGFVAGNIRKTDLVDIWQKSPFFKKLREIRNSDLEGVCALCVIKDYCYGGCRINGFINTGKFTTPNVLCQSFFDAGIFPKHAINLQ